MSELKRTHTIDEIIAEEIGTEATLMGWVAGRRDLGGLVFITLRDRWGELQCSFDPTESHVAITAAEKLRREFVVAFTGYTRRRPEKDRRDYPGGDRELVVREVKVIARAETPPLVVEEEIKASEEMRLRYRYLDLRRRAMVRNLTIRHRAVTAIREHLNGKGFLEVETPLLARSTPEGARDYVVPSRVHPGRFYALPQSPQLFKQILMCSGVDRYYQIARCLRDEDLRGNRQPEHTQLDVEMSFATRDELFELIEGTMAAVWKECLDVRLQLPFRRIPFDEAMARYGTDKPDLRFGCAIRDLTELWHGTDANFINAGLSEGHRIHGVFVSGAKLSRKHLDNWTATAKELGAAGLMTVELGAKKPTGSVARFVPTMEPFVEVAKPDLRRSDEGQGTWFMILGPERQNLQTLGRLRVKLGRRFDLVKKDLWAWAWIVDFPLYEEDEETGRVTPAHHAFTHPLAEHLDLLLSDDPQELLSIRADNYDLVLNGEELASGSLRIFDPDLQRKVLRKIGLSDAEIEDRFGWFLEAYRYGAPPHRGIAPGIDRIVMALTGNDSIREVIAFPKTATASCPLTGAPSEIDEAQWRELGIRPRPEGP
jgi:aspartyl-tRNA synthetase